MRGSGGEGGRKWRRDRCKGGKERFKRGRTRDGGSWRKRKERKVMHAYIRGFRDARDTRRLGATSERIGGGRREEV